MLTESAAQRAEFVHLLEMEFSGGTIRFTTGSSNLSWSGHTWNASGSAMTFEAVQETEDTDAQSLSVTLDGVSLTAIAALLGEDYLGRNATLYLAHLADDGTVVPDPVVIWRGLMNEAWEVEENVDEGFATVHTSFISPLARFRQTRGMLADKNSHQRLYAGDTFFSHITQIPDGDIGWGFYTPNWGDVVRGV